MKKIICILRGHRWSEWEEIGHHLEKECLRCGEIRAKFPHWSVIVAELTRDLLLKYVEELKH